MEQENRRAFLTTKEVTERLGVTRKTVYNYAHSGKLKPINEENWQVDETFLFLEVDVIRLQRESEKPGLTTTEAAERLRVHPVTVKNYIKDGQLPAVQQLFYGKKYYFVHEDDLEQFQSKRHTKERNNPKGFYSSELKLYLFQSLVHKETNEAARIMDLDNDGLIKTENGETFPLTAMREYGFTPRESFLMPKYIYKHGFITFRFNRPNHIGSPILDLIESFYRSIGYKNIRLHASETFIHLEVKPFLFKELQGESNRHLVRILEDHLMEGKLNVRHNGVLLDAGVERLTVYVPEEVKMKLKHKAKERNISLADYITGILEMECKEDLHMDEEDASGYI